MKKIITALFCTLIFYSGFAQNSNSELERNFKENLITEIFSVDVDPSDYGLFRGELKLLNFEHQTFVVYDYSKHNLYEMVLSDLKNPEVLEVNEIGNGKGSGPGEFRNPTDLCITTYQNQSYTVLADPPLSRITIWDLVSKKIIDSFNPKISPFRISCDGDNIAIFSSSQSPGGSVGLYDFSGKLKNRFENANTSSDRGNSFSNSGYIAVDDSIVYYAGRGNISISKIDLKNGKRLHQNSIVDSQEFKNDVIVENIDDNSIRTKRGKKFIHFSKDVDIINQYFVVLHSGRKDAWSKVIDFYKKSDLTYQFSIKLPHFTWEMTIDGEVLSLEIFDEDIEETYLKFYKVDESKLYDL